MKEERRHKTEDQREYHLDRRPAGLLLGSLSMTNAQSLCLHAQKLGETGAQLLRLNDRVGDVAISDTPKIALQGGLALGASRSPDAHATMHVANLDIRVGGLTANAQTLHQRDRFCQALRQLGRWLTDAFRPTRLWGGKNLIRILENVTDAALLLVRNFRVLCVSARPDH